MDESHRSTVAVEPFAAVQIADRRAATKIYYWGEGISQLTATLLDDGFHRRWRTG
jgi:hypothetical protein